ncbi:unnamed protein product [Gulo gulo]|uniref:Uncharacterized protein n=1 Tax=Gulo gulo TaxID=48420 RepID=A0A9X9LWA6_GULGU|nr:unnamed protein product [Gulo gulo]
MVISKRLLRPLWGVPLQETQGRLGNQSHFHPLTAFALPFYYFGNKSKHKQS